MSTELPTTLSRTLLISVQLRPARAEQRAWKVACSSSSVARVTLYGVRDACSECWTNVDRSRRDDSSAGSRTSPDAGIGVSSWVADLRSNASMRWRSAFKSWALIVIMPPDSLAGACIVTGGACVVTGGTGAGTDAVLMPWIVGK